MSKQRYLVRSSSDPARFYHVWDTEKGLKCDCPAFKECRHIKRVREYQAWLLEQELKKGVDAT